MKTCPICGMEYQPATNRPHNGIHRTAGQVLDQMIDLGENASPEDVERFRRWWSQTVARGVAG